MNGTENVNLGTFFLSYTFKDLDFESNIFLAKQIQELSRVESYNERRLDGCNGQN